MKEPFLLHGISQETKVLTSASWKCRGKLSVAIEYFTCNDWPSSPPFPMQAHLASARKCSLPSTMTGRLLKAGPLLIYFNNLHISKQITLHSVDTHVFDGKDKWSHLNHFHVKATKINYLPPPPTSTPTLKIWNILVGLFWWCCGKLDKAWLSHDSLLKAERVERKRKKS